LSQSNHPDITDLARAELNGDELTIQLVRQRMPAIERTLRPTVVQIAWPPQPTIVDAARFSDTAAQLTRLFATASIELARIKAKTQGVL
jgi:hypothetical protein